jgi:hypothetical protein
MPPSQQKSPLPVAGGALILVSGILGIIWWGFIIAAGTTGAGMIPGLGSSIANIIIVCGAIGIIFSLLAVMGGVMGIMRKMWGLAIVGGIFGLLSIGYFLGSILGLVGLILVAISKEHFHH